MNTREISNKQESRVAKYLGGKVVPSSGSGKFNAGDVEYKDILIECKTVEKEQRSFTIKKEWLEKVEKQVFMNGYKHSALAFSFGDDKDYFVIDSKFFKELIENLSEV